ncbi:hypothetical protein FXO37_30887 [Capsicum annuum]|nr:hypothetical protein FXO37_30887 [Capsicum annuum]
MRFQALKVARLMSNGNYLENHSQTSLVLKVAVCKQDKLFKRVMNLPWCLMTLRIIAGSSIKSMEYSIPATSIGDRSGLLVGTLHLLDCCLQIFNLKISNYNRQLPYIAIEIQFTSPSPRAFQDAYSSAPSHKPIPETNFDTGLPSSMGPNPKYMVENHPMKAKWQKGQASAWKTLCATGKEIDHNIHWIVGKGEVSFWYDNWSNLGSLYQQIDNDTDIFDLQVLRKRFGSARIGDTWNAICQACPGSSNYAEATAMLFVLRGCLNNDPKPVWVETDSLLLTNSIKKDSYEPDNYSNLIEERDDLKASQKAYSAQRSSMQNHANKYGAAGKSRPNISCSEGSSLQAGQTLQTGYELACVSHDTLNGIGSGDTLNGIGSGNLNKLNLHCSANYSPEPSTYGISARPYMMCQSNYVTRSDSFTSPSPRAFQDVSS